MLFPFQITLAEKDCGGEDELRHYCGHVARWLGVDPLADKYPDVSPYAYCEDNPLMYVDPDGMETVNGFNPETDSVLYAVASNYYNDDFLHVFGHGSNSSMTIFSDGRSKQYKDVSLDDFIAHVIYPSKTWQNRRNDAPVLIILHSCRTAEGDNSFAMKLSKRLGNEAVVVAPDDRLYTSSKRQIGTYRAKYVNDRNEYKLPRNDPKRKVRSDKEGHWIFFQNGEIKDKKNGMWQTKMSFRYFCRMVGQYIYTLLRKTSDE